VVTRGVSLVKSVINLQINVKATLCPPLTPPPLGIDWMQENMECCGIQGAEDWSRDNNLATWWISTTGGNHVEDTPDSCCKIADGAEEVTAGCGTSAATGIVKTVYNGASS